MFKGHSHCENAWTYAAIIRNLISDDGSFGCIHDKPDITFDTSEFDVSFISGKYIFDIVVGQNVKSELDRRKAENDAEIRRLQAEADRAKAEADLRRAMVEQYEKGIKPNFNELHKANLLADKGENITTGYESPD